LVTRSAASMDSGGEGEDDDDEEDRFMPPALTIGEQCVCKPRTNSADDSVRLAKVMFVGMLPPPMPSGYWVGVMYEAKVGKNDGTLNGRRFFHCPPGHGGFVRPYRVKDMNEEKRRQEEAERAAEELRQRKEKGKKDKDKAKKPNEQTSEALADSTVHNAEGMKLEATPAASSAVDPSGTDVEGVASEGTGASTKASTRRARTQRAQRSRSARKTARAKTSQGQNASESPDTEASRAARQLAASRCRASGTGLNVAHVGTLAQFVVNTTPEGDGQPPTEPAGGSGHPGLTVRIRGRASIKDSQPATIRVKIIDRGDGSFMCEYKPWYAPRVRTFCSPPVVRASGCCCCCPELLLHLCARTKDAVLTPVLDPPAAQDERQLRDRRPSWGRAHPRQPICTQHHYPASGGITLPCERRRLVRGGVAQAAEV